MADPPPAIIAEVVDSAPTALTTLTMTCAPSLPKRRAIARPMPCAAPVTITILLVKRCCIDSLPHFSLVYDLVPERPALSRQKNMPLVYLISASFRLSRYLYGG